MMMKIYSEPFTYTMDKDNGANASYHLEQFTWISAWSWTFNTQFSASVKNFPVCSVYWKTTL